MNKNIVITAVIALIIGAGGGYVAATNSNDTHAMPDGTQMHGANHGMEAEMDAMTAALEGKTGDAFDKAFLSEMIVHHQGAVVMAEAALKNAKHAEIKSMAEAIISAQTNEIQQMQEWQKNWYGI